MTQPILVTGASGRLGSYVVSHLVSSGLEVVAWSGSRHGNIAGVPLRPVNLEEREVVRAAFEEARPSAVLHCAAVSAVSEAYRDYPRALRVNRDATELLSKLASRMVYVSTDLVFDGESAPYSEEDEARPLSRYGSSKLLGEQAVLDRPDVSMVRVSLLYGPTLFGEPGFFDHQLEALQQGRPLTLFQDEWRTPLALDDAARGLVEVLNSEHRGLLHLGGPQRLSRYEMGIELATMLGVERQLVKGNLQSEIDFPEPRPSDVSLDSGRARSILSRSPGSFSEGLRRMLSS